MYERVGIGDMAGAVDPEEVKRQVADFYNTFTRTRALSIKVGELSNAGLLDKARYDRHLELLANFRNLFVELVDALSPAQGTEVARWLMDVTPKMALIRKKFESLGALGVVPLLAIVLVVAGAYVTIKLTEVVARALADYNSELSRQEKDVAWLESMKTEVSSGKISTTDAIKLTEAGSRVIAPKKVNVSAGGILDIPGQIVDTIGANLTTFAAVGVGVLVLTLFVKR